MLHANGCPTSRHLMTLNHAIPPHTTAHLPRNMAVHMWSCRQSSDQLDLINPSHTGPSPHRPHLLHIHHEHRASDGCCRAGIVLPGGAVVTTGAVCQGSPTEGPRAVECIAKPALKHAEEGSGQGRGGGGQMTRFASEKGRHETHSHATVRMGERVSASVMFILC